MTLTLMQFFWSASWLDFSLAFYLVCKFGYFLVCIRTRQLQNFFFNYFDFVWDLVLIVQIYIFIQIFRVWLLNFLIVKLLANTINWWFDERTNTEIISEYTKSINNDNGPDLCDFFLQHYLKSFWQSVLNLPIWFSNFELFILLIKFCTCLLIYHILITFKQHFNSTKFGYWEFPFFLTLALVFLLLILSATDIYFFFVNLIGFNIAVFILMFNDPCYAPIRQGTLKYYYLSSISSAFIGFGMVFLNMAFYTTITFNLFEIAQQIELIVCSDERSRLFILIIGFIFFLSGLLFKLTAFPAMLWMADVYDSCTYSTLTLLLLPTKMVLFVFCTIILEDVFFVLHEICEYLLIYVALGTMLWGTLNALNEDNMKRFLGYASMSQLGFLFLGLTTTFLLGNTAKPLVYFYLFIYVIMNLPIFLILLETKVFSFALLRNSSKSVSPTWTFEWDLSEIQTFAQFNLFFHQNPLLSIILSLTFFSMAGIPPLLGFFGKYALIRYVFFDGGTWLVLIMLIMSLLSAYYYIKIIQLLLFQSTKLTVDLANQLILPQKTKNINICLIVFCAFLLLFSGFFWKSMSGLVTQFVCMSTCNSINIWTCKKMIDLALLII